MLQLKHGYDILAQVGGITDIAEAHNLFSRLMAQENHQKIGAIHTHKVLLKIANAAALLTPDAIWINSSTKEDFAFARAQALTIGEEVANHNKPE